MVKKNFLKRCSILMCSVLVAANLVACGAGTGSTNEEVKQSAYSQDNMVQTSIEKELSSKSTLPINTRQETVYVFGDANGNKDHIIVNEKVTDDKGKETLNRTESDGEVPVSMKVTYTLDGNEVTPEELAGKSGKVTMRFDYTNNTKDVPFTMITGMVLPADVFSNVEITNGKLTRNGNSIIAVGLAMPGLADMLNLKGIELPEYFEVTADVNKFSLDMTMSVATSNFLSDVNVDDISIDSIKALTDKLGSATGQLVDGSAALADGTSQLKDAVPALTDGITRLNTGALSLRDGMYAYIDGVNTVSAGASQLNSGASDLATGLDSLASAINTKVVPGITQMKNTVDANVKTYGGKVTSVLTLAGTYDKAFAALNNTIKSAGAAYGVSDMSVVPYSEMSSGLTEEKVPKLLTKYMSDYTFYISAKAAFAQADAYVSQMKLRGVDGSSVTNLGQVYQQEIAMLMSAASNGGVYTALSQVQTGVNQLSTGIGSMNDNTNATRTGNTETICSAIYKLQTGSKTLKDGTETLVNGLGTLTSNNDALKSGAAQVADGTGTLNDSAATLADAIEKLNAGAITLKDGMAQFNSEAIEPLEKLVGDDLQNAVDTIKKVVKSGQDYTSFLGKSDDLKGSVTFIYKTAGITIEE